MTNYYLSQDDCKSKLGKKMQKFRTDRPNEWQMDSFIRDAEDMYEEIVRLSQKYDELVAVKDGCVSQELSDKSVSFRDLQQVIK